LKTARIRREIKIFLMEGKKNIVEIQDHINGYFRHGTTMHQLGNVLSKDEDIIKVGKVQRKGITNGKYLISEWALNPNVATF
jgi:hypothetical protein